MRIRSIIHTGMKGREKPTARRIAGKYELMECAGEGGMAVVWKGVMHGAAGFTRPVAMKQIKPELRHDLRQVAMFVEEARLGSHLLHPNVAQVFDFVEDEQHAYWLVTEWVDGIDLGTLLRYYGARQERMPWPLVTLVGIGALHGLEAAHERHSPDGTPVPIVHRDVSPQNLLLGVGGAVKLSDFGLARARDRTSVLTTPGFIKGKLGYLAPELVGGAPASPQSDIFAMGSVLWESLTGHPLFTGKNDREVLRAIHRGQVASVGEERPGLPKMLVFAVGRALGRTPADRYPSAGAMAQDLEGALAGALMSTLEIQVRLGRAVAEARRHFSHKNRRPESRSTLRMQAYRSRLDMTRRSRG
jgi:eukaryotic-like serine/threonine-protein kinase